MMRMEGVMLYADFAVDCIISIAANQPLWIFSCAVHYEYHDGWLADIDGYAVRIPGHVRTRAVLCKTSLCFESGGHQL
jgi:hypothetical protein